MDDQQLLRYSRHILLPEIGIEGQERLRGGAALIVGASYGGVADADDSDAVMAIGAALRGRL